LSVGIILLEFQKFTYWCFSGRDKKFTGDLSIDKNNGGVLILKGDKHLGVEIDKYKKSLTKDHTNHYVYLWGTTDRLSSKGLITIIGFENHRHIGNCMKINITVRNFLVGRHISSFN
jgi:hypothetical protein